jgi:hypothetical protein
MIISTKERSYLLRKRREQLLLLFDEEEDLEKQRHLIEKIEIIEDELERLAAE